MSFDKYMQVVQIPSQDTDIFIIPKIHFNHFVVNPQCPLWPIDLSFSLFFGTVIHFFNLISYIT